MGEPRTASSLGVVELMVALVILEQSHYLKVPYRFLLHLIVPINVTCICIPGRYSRLRRHARTVGLGIFHKSANLVKEALVRMQQNFDFLQVIGSFVRSFYSFAFGLAIWYLNLCYVNS